MSNREIIVLSYNVSAGTLKVRAAYWLVAPAVLTVPLPTFTSQVPTSDQVPGFGMTSTELGLLRAGILVEQVNTIPINNSGVTASVQSALQTQLTTLQAALNAQAFSQPHLVLSSYNGTSWTAGP